MFKSPNARLGHLTHFLINSQKAVNSKYFPRTDKKLRKLKNIIGISEKIPKSLEIIGKGYLSAKNC